MKGPREICQENIGRQIPSHHKSGPPQTRPMLLWDLFCICFAFYDKLSMAHTLAHRFKIPESFTLPAGCRDARKEDKDHRPYGQADGQRHSSAGSGGTRSSSKIEYTTSRAGQLQEPPHLPDLHCWTSKIASGMQKLKREFFLSSDYWLLWFANARIE